VTGGYYDTEAPVYDETRGGTDRAEAAADAIDSLVPGTGTALDVAGGTGIVSAELAARGWTVLVADASVGMLGVAASRLPGRVLAADAAALPVRY
jgi:ubiquinone/menaquinone biosynthesis C-methylase UbiE